MGDPLTVSYHDLGTPVFPREAGHNLMANDDRHVGARPWALFVGVLLLGMAVSTAAGEGNNEREIALEFARQRFVHVIAGSGTAGPIESESLDVSCSDAKQVVARSGTGDPLARQLADLFCKDARRILLPHPCPARSDSPHLYQVDVLDIYDSEIVDIVAVAGEGPYSVRGVAGFGRWIRERGLSCSTVKEYLNLVRYYLALRFTRVGSEPREVEICGNEAGPDLCVCSAPRVDRVNGGFRVELAVVSRSASYGEDICSRREWVFELTDEFRARMVEP